MQWDGATSNLDISTAIDKFCGTTDTSFPQAEKVMYANFALDRVWQKITLADNTWEFDDQNYSTIPIDTFDLVANQEDYSISNSHLIARKLRIKDPNGNWISLTPKDRRELTDAELTATAGTPTSYDKIGNSIFLNPKPSYSSNEGGEIQYQRGMSHFVVGDTTKEPGFASAYHMLVPLFASLDYCEFNELEGRARILRPRIQVMEQNLIEYYASRAWDEKNRMTVKQEDYGQTGLYGISSKNPDGFL